MIAWLDRFPVMNAFDFTFDHIRVDGNLATAVGKGSWTLDIDGEKVSATFKFADVFRKVADDEWRYEHVIWNLDSAE